MTPNKKTKRELQLLFYALCDGLRQEVRHRSLAYLVTGEDFSIIDEREIGVASALASHLRSIGFVVQLESYFVGGHYKRRPDFRIWLPASGQYIYLELKTTAWGNIGRQYYYQHALNEIQKLDADFSRQSKPNGLIALGFSKNPEKQQDWLVAGFKGLSKKIISKYPYAEIGIEKIDLQGMDSSSSYAMVGLWFRN